MFSDQTGSVTSLAAFEKSTMFELASRGILPILVIAIKNLGEHVSMYAEDIVTNTGRCYCICTRV